MNNQLLNKRMPTVVGILFIIFAIVLTTIFVKNQTDLRSKAENSIVPQNVKISNISNDSFTITYQTEMATSGSVNYGKDKQLGSTELEDLDKEKGSFSPKNIHSITVKKLTPATKYQLVIVSGQNTYLNNGIPYQIETGPTISSSASATKSTINGKVLLPDGNIAQEALVFLNSDDSELLSTLVDKNGEFNFSLKSLRTSDLSSYLNVEGSTLFKLVAVGKSLKANVLFSLNEADSLPTITLSNDYDFTNEIAPIASKAATGSFPTITVNPLALKPQILTPKKDQSFTDQKPQFRGTSLPNETVEITIRSDEQIQTQVKADGSGNWSYRPPNNLTPGTHTITIKTRDAGGILTTIMQSFTVFAAGTQVSESATPSATPTQRPTPAPTFIPTPTIFSASSITPLPTLVPSGTKRGLPPTGTSSTFLMIGGVITTISGILLFLLTRTL